MPEDLPIWLLPIVGGLGLIALPLLKLLFGGKSTILPKGNPATDVLSKNAEKAKAQTNADAIAAKTAEKNRHSQAAELDAKATEAAKAAIKAESAQDKNNANQDPGRVLDRVLAGNKPDSKS